MQAAEMRRRENLDLVSKPSVQDGMGSDHAVLDLVQRVAISPSDGEAVGDHDDRGLARKTVNGLHHRRLGAVSLLGPQRMDYEMAIRSVQAAARELSDFVEDIYAEN